MPLSEDRITPDYDYNPFASASSLTTSPVESEFPSRYASTSSASSSRSSSILHSPRRNHHARAQTEVLTTSHPLRGATSSNDAHVTRPTLTRRIKTGQIIDIPGGTAEDEEADIIPAPDEKTVLLHEVSARDSLAGVSLKYGISLADLRRANHLWTTDSIHLRKVLYIPLDKASRAHLFLKEKTPPPLVSICCNDEADCITHLNANNHDSHSKHHTVVERSPSSKVRRVPISEMSFFPPSSSKIPPQRKLFHSPIPTPLTRPSFHGRFASSPPNNSLNSLLTALPIAASTRDTIIARLSFDSTSTSYSDRVSNDEMHPLDDVPAKRRSDDTPRPLHRRPRESEPPSSHLVHGAIAMGDVQSVCRSARVCTNQLEPSPAMHLPASNGLNGRGKVRPSLASVDFEASS